MTPSQNQTARSCQLLGSIVSVALLCLPALQSVAGLAATRGLGGVETSPRAMESLTLGTWSSGSFQEALEAQLSQNLGLRDWMIRLDNELRWRAFGSTKRPVVAGVRATLFQEGYLPARALSHDFESAMIVLRLANLLLLQTTLDQRGICLLLCISPSKGAIYPELLPLDQRWVRSATADQNCFHDVARACVRIGGIRCIDFAQQFRDWRESDAPGTPPLFTRGGTHWSNHAAARAAVKLLDFVEKELGRDIENIDIVGTEASATPRDDEADLADLANVLDESSFIDPSPQPVLARRANDRGQPVKTLFVGTSFLWGLSRSVGKVLSLDNTKVWYYFNSLFDFVGNVQRQVRPLTTEKADLVKAISSFDVVIVEINESVLTDMGQGFVEAMLHALGREPLKALGELPPEVVQAIRQALKVR